MTKSISLNLVAIPPGGASLPHSHAGFETAIYIIAGRVQTQFGPGLRESLVTEAGDFLYIPPGMPHQAVNCSVSERALALVARNVADEQESVVPYER